MFIELEGKPILIFGGTGTIGTIFTEVLMAELKQPNIYLATNNEFEIWEAKQRWNNKLNIIFADIRDKEETRKIFINVKPYFVINCAALKHVDYCEKYVMNAIKTNILGLENILYLANEYKTSYFLQVSTDKAVEPISVMGATKFIGECLCREWDKMINGVMCIRLGNVIDSRGSLLPTIKKQLETTQSVSITDYRMKRYMITTHELKEFIKSIFPILAPGHTYIPVMQEQNVFEFILSKLKELSSQHQIEIKTIGIRPGEKLREKLWHEYEYLEKFPQYYEITWR